MSKRKKSEQEKSVEVNADVSVEDAADAAVETVETKLPGTWEGVEDRMKAALASVSASAEISKTKIVVYGETMEKAKNNEAIVWRILGQALRGKIIDSYPEVEKRIGEPAE